MAVPYRTGREAWYSRICRFLLSKIKTAFVAGMRSTLERISRYIDTDSTHLENIARESAPAPLTPKPHPEER